MAAWGRGTLRGVPRMSLAWRGTEPSLPPAQVGDRQRQEQVFQAQGVTTEAEACLDTPGYEFCTHHPGEPARLPYGRGSVIPIHRPCWLRG